MGAKFFPMNLAKFKRVGADKVSTTLRHDDGHEIKIAHGVLSPKLRGHLAELPLYKGGEIKKQPKQAAPDQTPPSMVENPHYEEGVTAKYMSAEAAADTKGLEEPVIDPVSLGVNVATGGLSAVGPTMAIAAKNAASKTLGDATKQALASRQQRIASQGSAKAETANQVGQNTGYTPTAAPVSYQKQMIEGVRALPKKSFYKDGGEVMDDSNNPKLEESKKQPPIPARYAEGALVDPNDMTQQAISQGQPIVEAQGVQAVPTADPSVSRKRELYNTIAPTVWRIDEAGNTPRLDPASWGRAEELFNEEQQSKVAQAQQANSQATAENAARQAAGLPPVEVPALSPEMTQVGHPAPAAAQPAPMASPTQAAAPQDTASALAMDPLAQAIGQNSLQSGIDQQKQGLMKEASAIGAQGRAEAAQLQESINNRQAAEASYQEQYNTLNQERSDFQHDLENAHVDPQRYWNNMGTAGKVSTAIGLILGGMGGGLLHQENPALKFLNAQIDRDIKSQEAELGKRENLLAANMKQFGNMRDATDMTRIMQNDIVSMQLKQAAAQAQDPIAKARAMQAAGKIDIDTSEMQGKLAMRRTLTNAQALIQKDPMQAQKYIAMLQQVDPKQAADLQERLVPGIGFANTKDDAKMAKEALTRKENIKQNITAVQNMIKKAGTYELLGSHNQDLDRRIDQIATDMAKLQDPNSVARPGEVELVKRTLAGPGVFKRDSTAQSVMKNFSKEVDKRADTLLRQHGLSPVDPMTKLTPQQKSFVEWAKKNPNDPKSALVLQKLGIE